MKKFFGSLLFAVLMCSVSFGQKAVMMGKVIDESGKPVSGAEIKVTGHRVYYKVKTNADGLYNTPLIEPASYHIIIDANNKYYTSDKVKISKPGDVREFYNFSLANNQAVLHIDDSNDPFMVAKLEKIEADLGRTFDVVTPSKENISDPDKVVRVPKNEKKEDTAPARNSNTSVKIIPGEKQEK